MQLENLRIGRIVLHKVPQKPADGSMGTPEYSNVLTAMNQGGLDTLSQRIIGVAGHQSYCVEMDVHDVTVGSTFQVAAGCADCNDADFLQASKRLADKLNQAQTTRSIPDSVLVALDGTVGVTNKNIVILIKAETHAGFNLNAGNGQILMDYLDELLLTPQQRLYKVALFVEDTPPERGNERQADDHIVFVYDHNIRRGSEMATYFYQGFLGCDFAPTDKRLTKEFYDNSQEAFDSLPMEEEEKMDLKTHLYSYLKSQNQIVSPRDFAEDHLTPELRDPYVGLMEDSGFPEHAVSKDLTLLERKLSRRKIRFSTGVNLTGPSEDFDKVVNIVRSDNDSITVEIRGQIKNQT